MHSKAFNDNAKRVEDTVTGYHVHIYFEPGTPSQAVAYELARQLPQVAPGAVRGAHAIGAIGPHIQSNVAVELGREGFGAAVSWLQINGGGLSILIHPETGDERKDHLESALWLGRQLGYNPAFFGLAKAAPRGP